MLTQHRLIGITAVVLAVATGISAESGNLLPSGNFEPGKGSAPEKDWVMPAASYQRSRGFTAAIIHYSEVPGGPFVNRWLGLTSTNAANAANATCIVALPPGTRRVKISGRFRVDKIIPSAEPKWAGAFVGGAVWDAEKRKLAHMPNPFRFTAPTAGWVKNEGVMELPEGAAFLQLQPGLYHATGDFAVDDLELYALPAK